MIVEILTIGKRRGGVFRLLAFLTYGSFFQLYLVWHNKKEYFEGFGLLCLEVGKFIEYRDRFGIKVRFLWWKWHWLEKLKNNAGWGSG